MHLLITVGTLISILSSVAMGILFALPGIYFGSYLEKKKIATNRPLTVLAFSVFFVFFRQIWYPQLPYIVLAVIIILGTTMGLYKMEIWWAMKDNRDEPELDEK